MGDEHFIQVGGHHHRLWSWSGSDKVTGPFLLGGKKMLLKVRSYELEIVQEKFVCLGQNDGEISHFSEWKYLDPKLQEKFRAISEELMEVMGKFVNSEDGASFEAISEEFKNDQPDCGIPKT